MINLRHVGPISLSILVFTALWPTIMLGTEARYQHIGIAADHPLASQAGLEVHKAGGNVVDVAAAVGFALSVVRPASSGIGGGGFMVIWDAEKQRAIAIDYRERAPGAATAKMYYGPDGEPIPKLSQTGALAVAVPHHVAGLCHAVEKYGKLKLEQVLAPAIRLAEEGFPLDEHGVAVRRSTLKVFRDNPEYVERYATFYKKYLNHGQEPKLGQIVQSPIRRMLKIIAKQGRVGFYEGPAAEALVNTVQTEGGLISLEDMKSAFAKERPILEMDYADGTVVCMPPPSSGGVALMEILNILDALNTNGGGELLHPGAEQTTTFRHAMTEAMKHAFADRATYLGDPDYADIPTQKLISKQYASKLSERIDRTKTLPLTDYGRVMPVEDAGTTHFSIIDQAGNAVACTETINLGFGSYVVVPETGVLLNNEMDDFAAKPGTPNAFGLVQSEAAAVGPGRRPLSSMTPTIFIRDGKAVLAVGASGGPKIITATLQVFLNVVHFQMSPVQAVAAPRQHHQWLPNVLALEPGLESQLGEALRSHGHEVKKQGGLAACQIVVRSADGIEAASDPRKGGQPAGN